MQGNIYALFDSSGLRYIGQTIQPVEKRLKQHVHSSSKLNSHLGCWLRSLNDSPTIELLETCNSINLDNRELAWIKEFQILGCELVNSMTASSKGGHHTHSEETKRKIGEHTKRVHTGMKRSQETKDKIRESALNRSREGVRTSNKCILQYSKEGVLIKEWGSITEAAKSLGGDRQNISKCCRGITKTSYNYEWKYKNLKRILKQIGYEE